MVYLEAMKKLLPLLLPAVLLAACASGDYYGGRPPQGPPQYGYKPGESAPTVISEVEFNQLTEGLTDLYNQRHTLAGLMRTTPDPMARNRYAADIDGLNARIAPMEYRLRAANRPLPPLPR